MDRLLTTANAQQKAMLNLFDRRFKIYETVKNCVDQVNRNPQYFSEREKEFRKAVLEARHRRRSPSSMKTRSHFRGGRSERR
jgi:hypothetical protein